MKIILERIFFLNPSLLYFTLIKKILYFYSLYFYLLNQTHLVFDKIDWNAFEIKILKIIMHLILLPSI